MVTRKRFRTVLNVLALYTIAALVIGYFGVNAYSGNRGLRAKQDLDQQIAELSAELEALKAERANWERRVSLLKPESIDPDMLDERARVLLNYADPREPTLRLKHPGGCWPAGSRILRTRFFLPISRRKEPRPRLSPSASALRRFRLWGKWLPHRRRAHPEEKNGRCQQQ